MSETLTINLSDSDATEAAGSRLAQAIAKTQLPERQFNVHLLGDLGAGKTTFSRGFLRGWGHQGRVPSPTYTLIEPYEELQRPVYHLDLYRLQDGAELEFLGLEDLPAQSVLLIEWPQRAAGELSPPDMLLSLSIDGDGRRLEVQPASADGALVAAEL